MQVNISGADPDETAAAMSAIEEFLRDTATVVIADEVHDSSGVGYGSCYHIPPV